VTSFVQISDILNTVGALPTAKVIENLFDEMDLKGPTRVARQDFQQMTNQSLANYFAQVTYYRHMVIFNVVMICA